MERGQIVSRRSERVVDPNVLPTGTVVDRYEVLGLLGVGGIARVYRVRHRQLGSLHALKVLALDRPSIRDRAVQEGRVQAKLKHPNVVPVTDIVDLDGSPALVLEYVAGPALDQLLSARQLSLEEVDPLARGILQGVAFAHAHGVVHRDLKPGNILLEIVGERLVPRVTDFGIAKLLIGGTGAVRTLAGTVMGTPPYMSPEQGMDASLVDARADVWALGVVLYELASGRSAMDGLPPNPAEDLLARGLPRRVAQAVGAALQPVPRDRPADAERLLQLWNGGRMVPAQAGATCAPATLAAAYALRPRLQEVEGPVSTFPTRNGTAAWRSLLATGLVALVVGAVTVAAVLSLIGGA